MIRLAVIGTNWITDKFIEAALQTEQYKLLAVYSRNKDTAENFGNKYGNLHYFTALDELATSAEIDAVYIASPNSLHYQQAKLLLSHGKHIICEKPLTSNYEQTNELIELARKKQLVLFEAVKTLYLPNYTQIKTYLPKLGKLRKVFFNYCQYSSRYSKYLQGDLPNTFNPEFSGGSIMDIGIYCVSTALALWGKPTSIQASAALLDSHVDAHGSIIMNYGDFDVVVFHSKVSDSKIASEIQGEMGSIVIEHIADCEKVIYNSRTSSLVNITLNQHENHLFYEAQTFAKLVKNRITEHPGLNHSLLTSEVITEIRHQTGVVFPADLPSES
jgi:predicted dehydrogenase